MYSTEDIKSLTKEANETLWLEHKYFWYWKESDKEGEKQKGWSEFLKDFSALFNTYYDDSLEKRYMIFGYDEKTESFINFFEDRDRNIINELLDISIFKEKLVKQLKSTFECCPTYKKSNELNDIDKMFSFDITEISSKKILVITFQKVPYYLRFKRGVKDVRENNVLIRHLKDGEPEICVAKNEIQDKLKEIAQLNRENTYLEHDTTIEAIVKTYIQENFPKAIDKKTPVNIYSENINFEFFTITGDRVLPTYFIYLKKNASQEKSLRFIKDNYEIKNNNVFLLVDKHNSKGGLTDTERLKKLLDSIFGSEEIYVVEEFALKYFLQDLAEDNIFYTGSKLIENSKFVKPYTEDHSGKTADIILKEWYNDSNPLLVLKGVGGCGKTTVVKKFIENLYKENNSNYILFISSSQIINEVMRYPHIEDIFDLYNLLAEKQKVSKKLNKELLRLSSDLGNVFIVIDGIDEIIAKKGDEFDLTKFIGSIFSHYAGNINRTKIIMTCRDLYWDFSHQDLQVKTINLKPFTLDLVKKYFQSSLGNEKDINACIKLAEYYKFQNSEGEDLYVPYVLDMIRENIISNDTSLQASFDSELLNKENNNDFIIYKACEREIRKLGNFSVDEQIEILMYLSIKYEGHFTINHLERLLEKSSSEKNLKKFQEHPLLVFQDGILTFRYDFFNSLFKQIALYNCVKNSFENLNDDLIDLIIKSLNFDNDFTKDMKSRFINDDFDTLVLEILEQKEGEFGGRVSKKNRKFKKINSAFLALLLALDKTSNKSSRTDLIKTLYFNNEKCEVEGLSIIDLYDSSKKIVFDFSDLKFNDCTFDNYDLFAECTFNENTRFKNCTFKSKLIKNNIKPNFSEKNFDFSTCEATVIKEILSEIDDEKANLEQKIRKELKDILKVFWTGYGFIEKKADQVNNKLKHSKHTLDKLIKIGVVKEIRKTSKEKRQDQFFELDGNYIELRKIFEENESCSVFDKLIKEIQNL